MAKWKAEGEWNGEFLPMESEHSALSAAIASEASGARTFTASSSQGLLLMHEMLYVASGMRMPLVMVNCSRGLSSPITLWSDHNDILAMRDSGWLIFFAKNNQEVLDSIIMAYKIAEDRNVLLPVLINLEGYILSYTREPALIPSQSSVDRFLPHYNPKTILDPARPMSLGVPAIDQDYMYFRSQVHKAQLNSIDIIKSVCKDFKKQFKRQYNLVEHYKTKDAKIIFVAAGSICTSIQEAVNSLRRKKIKAGLLRLRCLRPFPKKDIQILNGCENVAVIDNNISPGLSGILYPEICSAIENKNISDFIISLGGKVIGKKEFEKIAQISLRKKGKFWIF